MTSVPRRGPHPSPRAAAFLAATLALGACGGPPPATGITPTAGDGPPTAGYLRVGDRVTIRVWRQSEFTGDFYITEQGVIGHPIFRTLGRVSGRAVEELQPLIESFLREYEQQPNVVVEPFFRVAVSGEVRQPNVHYLRPGTTVAEAVSLAGGVTDRALTDRVTLRRGGRDYILDLSDPTLSHRTSAIYSGDEIIVSRRVNVFREYILPAVGFAGAIASIYRAFSR